MVHFLISAQKEDYVSVEIGGGLSFQQFFCERNTIKKVPPIYSYEPCLSLQIILASLVCIFKGSKDKQVCTEAAAPQKHIHPLACDNLSIILHSDFALFGGSSNQFVMLLFIHWYIFPVIKFNKRPLHNKRILILNMKNK